MTFWFKEQFVGRTLGATVWTFLLQIPLVIILKLLLGGNGGMWTSLTFFLRFSGLFHMVILAISVCCLFFIQCRVYRVEPKVYQTRWTMIKEMVSPLFLLLLAVYGTTSGILVNTYANLALSSLGSLSLPCSQRKNFYCLNEPHLFGVVFGCFLGLAESWSLFFTDRRLLKIPQIHQHVSATIRSNAVSLIKNSLTDTGKYYLAYLFFYLIFGETISSRLVRLTRLQVEEPLNNLMGLLSISLAYQYILVGAFCIVTIRLSNLLFQLFQMKPMSFPVTAYPDDSKPLLHEVLASDMPLLQIWGCRDWSGLAEQSEERRALIFTVSQPGNHPHNWNNIISAILPQCSAFVAALTGKEPVLKKEEVALAREPLTSPDTSIITSPTRLRSMALKSPVRNVDPVIEQPAPGLNDKIQLKVQDLIDNFKRRPFIQFIWGELPDAKRRQIFAKSQPIIFLVEGLSHFVAASFTEDRFGVVQKDLSDILSLLLSLQAATEVRVASTGVMQKRVESLASPPADVVMKHTLKWTVKSAIYRIVVKFQRHIMNVPLSSEHKQMLEQYLEFRVG